MQIEKDYSRSYKKVYQKGDTYRGPRTKSSTAVQYLLTVRFTTWPDDLAHLVVFPHRPCPRAAVRVWAHGSELLPMA